MKKLQNIDRTLLSPLKPSIWHSQVPAVITTSVLAVLFLFSGGTYLMYQANELAYNGASVTSRERSDSTEPFPIGVDPSQKLITENPDADSYLENPASRSLASNSMNRILPHVMARLSRLPWYQNLASPSARILIIEPGERKEQVVEHFGRLLSWTTAEREEFEQAVGNALPAIAEGKFYPGTYVVARDANPLQVAKTITTRFDTEILSRYPESLQKIVPLEDTLTIASLLEREAYDFEDMRFISGVIWNRLFVGMKLQIDATMQYARAGNANEWWPTPRSEDKDIDSPYNTYRVTGLPPTPIASPSLSSILAALNPRKTDCLYYLHDADGGFHCSTNYEDHVALIAKYYGQ